MIRETLMRIYFGAPAPGSTSDFPTGLEHNSATGSQLHAVLQIVFAVAAALAVLMIVIAGLRFVIGQGNPQEMSKARNTIVYALIGLLLALTAEAFVTLVLTKI